MGVLNALVLAAGVISVGARLDEWSPFGSPEASGSAGDTSVGRPITVVDGDYSDTRFRVRAGSIVSFGNRDAEVHSFTAEGGLFDSGLVEPGGSYRWSSGAPREVLFHCEIHPRMEAVLVVEEA